MQGFLTIAFSALANLGIVAGIFTAFIADQTPDRELYGLACRWPMGAEELAGKSFDNLDRINIPYLPTLDRALGLELINAESLRSR